MAQKGWSCFKCGLTELNLDFVLCSGQSFRWKKTDGCWFGVHRKRVWQLRQDDAHIWYKVLNPEITADLNNNVKHDKIARKRQKTSMKKGAKYPKLGESTENRNGNSEPGMESVKDELPPGKADSSEHILKDYFQLNFNLEELCRQWAKADSHFSSIYDTFPGVRMLRQDPVENLFSFICSSNNNITRISGMVEKMCKTFGEKICETSSVEYYSSPKVEDLVKLETEQILRGLGFGYRAKYIHQTAVKLQERGGERWLLDLRGMSYNDAHGELVRMPGVGAKVADCVCMMSLDKPEAVPVDTHIWQIAVRDYKVPKLVSTKTMTPASYLAIGDFFRKMWGSHAAWAMNFLFVADLKQFQYLKKSRDQVTIKT